MIEVRRLDKLIDELAKGKDMSKILRVPGNIDEYISIQFLLQCQLGGKIIILFILQQ